MVLFHLVLESLPELNYLQLNNAVTSQICLYLSRKDENCNSNISKNDTRFEFLTCSALEKEIGIVLISGIPVFKLYDVLR